MTADQASSLGIVAYLTLFVAVGVAFLFVNLLLGRFLRPKNPLPTKLEIYECGEPAIGSSFVQFDLRFYVVALLFIIFDVEVAFFFPWATVFGKATLLADQRLAVVQPDGDGRVVLTDQARMLYRELGETSPVVPTQVPASLESTVDADGAADTASQIIKQGASQLAWITIVDMAVFFGVLMIGFAYVWRRGDLDWVRALRGERLDRQASAAPAASGVEEPALSL